MNILGYYVLSNGRWLDDSEHAWTDYFHHAAEFTDAKLAHDIGMRQCNNDVTAFHVLACLGMQS